MWRQPEEEVLLALEKLGVGFVPYSPLGRGFLTGAMNKDTRIEKSDFRSMLPRFTPEAMEANQALVDLFKRIAEQKKATPAQIALTWLLVQRLGRADPRHHQVAPARREHPRGERPTDCQRSRGDRACGVRNHGQGRALSGTAYDDDWPVSGWLPARPRNDFES